MTKAVTHLPQMMEHYVYHDCFYRNMYKYSVSKSSDYTKRRGKKIEIFFFQLLSMLDIDEMIVPSESLGDWPTMLDKIRSEKDFGHDGYSYFVFDNHFFYDKVTGSNEDGGGCSLEFEPSGSKDLK